MEENITDNEGNLTDNEDIDEVPLVKERKPRSEKQIEAFKKAQQKRNENIKSKSIKKEIIVLDKKEKQVKSKHEDIIKKKQSLIKNQLLKKATVKKKKKL